MIVITLLSTALVGSIGYCTLVIIQRRAFSQKVDELQAEKLTLSEERSTLRTRLEEEQKHTAEQIKTLEDAELRLEQTFKASSQDALETNSKMFLNLAESTFAKFQQSAEGSLESRHAALTESLKPLKESLVKVDQKIGDLETARVGAYEGLVQQVKGLLETGENLRKETSTLAQALKSPTSRGRWGELQLKRVVELAGMLAHCDFYEQLSESTAEGRKRPDMVVRLPGNKNVVVDAKAPLSAYLEALESSDHNIQKQKFAEHAVQVRRHINQLSQKSYWDQFKPAPEFVILFLPSETFYSAALEQDPAILEHGVHQRVIVATPTTLIALLRAVAYGWRGESINQNALQIAELGKQLYTRVSDMTSHMSELGRHLGNSVKSYNKTLGTVERRVLVTARRFEELDCNDAAKPLKPLEPLEGIPRDVLEVAPIIGAASEDLKNL